MKDVKKFDEAVRDVPKSLGEINKADTRIKSLGGLHYNIQIILPATRDTAIYDALFKSLKDHLIE